MPLDLTHDPTVRSLLEDKGKIELNSFSLEILFVSVRVVIFSNYKQRPTQQNGDGQEEDYDSD